jgi:hypothetical protein
MAGSGPVWPGPCRHRPSSPVTRGAIWVASPLSASLLGAGSPIGVGWCRAARRQRVPSVVRADVRLGRLWPERWADQGIPPAGWTGSTSSSMRTPPPFTCPGPRRSTGGSGCAGRSRSVLGTATGAAAAGRGDDRRRPLAHGPGRAAAAGRPAPCGRVRGGLRAGRRRRVLHPAASSASAPKGSGCCLASSASAPRWVSGRMPTRMARPTRAPSVIPCRSDSDAARDRGQYCDHPALIKRTRRLMADARATRGMVVTAVAHGLHVSSAPTRLMIYNGEGRL